MGRYPEWWSSRVKTKKETMDWNHTLDQMSLTDIYGTFYQITAEYTFFLSAYGTFSKLNQMIEHKTILKI